MPELEIRSWHVLHTSNRVFYCSRECVEAYSQITWAQFSESDLSIWRRQAKSYMSFSCARGTKKIKKLGALHLEILGPAALRTKLNCQPTQPQSEEKRSNEWKVRTLVQIGKKMLWTFAQHKICSVKKGAKIHSCMKIFKESWLMWILIFLLTFILWSSL